MGQYSQFLDLCSPRRGLQNNERLSVVEAKGDEVAKNFAERRITLFTDQLNESNPILTRISDAMTEEGVLREQAEEAEASGDSARAAELNREADKHMAIKDGGNGLLQTCSGKYNDLMKQLRQEHAAALAAAASA